MNRLDREIEDLERFREIIKILAEEGFGFMLDKVNLWKHVPVAKRIKHSRETVPGPVRLRETLERLGPTFIKFGQIMAERPDIVPEKCADELKKLQDTVPAFDSSEAMKIIDEEVGLDNFAKVEEEPLAAASIAQVHRATLKTGEEVVIKVRRPDIKDKINQDLDILKFLTKESEKHLNAARKAKILKMVDEFARWTRNELDLKREAENAKIFRKNMERHDNIKIPEVWSEHTTEKVLVMEYIDGVKPTSDELADFDISRQELADTAVEAGFKQVAVDGFFHADPHPSNFLIQRDNTIVYLDFGMMGEIPKNLRDKITLIFIYAMNEDAKKLVSTLKEIGYTSEDADIERIEEEAADKLLRIKNSTISDVSITREFLDLIIVAGQNGLHLPMTLSLMGKNMMTLEGIGMELYPDFKVNQKYKDIGLEVIKQQNDPEEISKEIALDITKNREILANPVSFMKETLENNQTAQKIQPQRVKPEIDIELLPAALIICSTIMIIGSVIDQRLLYLGLAELALGIFLYLK